MKILFFIGSLCLGGKERRLIELLSYLKKNTNYSLILVMRRDEIVYPAFKELNIPYIVLTNKYYKRDKTLHYKFYKICKEYNPDIIHSWGNMPAFVSILAIFILKIPHVNSQIADAPPNIRQISIRNLINKINFLFSTIIISNSVAGLIAYKIKNKNCKVIYNGVFFNRFINLPNKEIIRSKYSITSKYTIAMVAEFSNNKDFDRFIDLANMINKSRNDISFLAVGNGINLDKIKMRVMNAKIKNIIFTGKIEEVEGLVNVIDVGVLFSNAKLHGEGISNSITEYMALGKPVIANDAGGTKEILKNGVNGYLVTNENAEEIANLIIELINDENKRKKIG